MTPLLRRVPDSHDALDDHDEPDRDEHLHSTRISPEWSAYRNIFAARGVRLDTVRDVREYYARRGEHFVASSDLDALCPDPGLPDNLFRAKRARDGAPLVVKAVRSTSNELHVVRYLSAPQLRDHPLNHTIPVIDIIMVPREALAFIVQEEWCPALHHASLYTPGSFLAAMRQFIEGVAFMHSHGVAHLDISAANVVANFRGDRFAFIDFETARRSEPSSVSKRICVSRGTELAPELERGDECCPFKVDVWALAVLILRASKATGCELQALPPMLHLMLSECPEQRPSARRVLAYFDHLTQAL